MLLKSYAKINLYLNILGRDKENYHNLDSLFAYVDLFDLLQINKIKEEKHKIEGDYLIDNENIILKTIFLFEKNYQIKNPQKFQIKQQKNIPIGAGLGGGSSNAAVILDFLYDFYEIKEVFAKKIELALQLGADVPFFMSKEHKILSGRGEKIEKIVKNLPEYDLLIIKPKQSLATKDIFDLIRKEKNSSSSLQKQEAMNDILNSEKNWNFLKKQKNALTKAAIKLCPEIANILNYYQDNNDIIARMTGSGSCCFFLYKNILDSLEIAKIDKKFTNHLIIKTKIKNNVY